jgi:integrase
MKSLTLSQAIEGFLLEKEGQRLSPHTIAEYQVSFRKLEKYLGDPDFAAISLEQMRGFMVELAKPSEPAGIAPRPAKVLSNKTVLNIHTALSALWTWAVREGITRRHLLRDIPRPKAERRAVTPFTEEDVKAVLAVCDRSKPYTRPGKRLSDHGRTTGLRDRAIILLLVDTGIRASELCGMTIQQVDLKTGLRPPGTAGASG